MALPIVISRNQVQKTNKRVIQRADTSGYPITYYTVPSGKIAQIKGTWLCNDTGAAGTVDLNVAGISFAEVQASGGGTDINIPQNLLEGLLFPFEIQLNAGETLACSQDSGTNSNTRLNIVIEEFNI